MLVHRPSVSLMPFEMPPLAFRDWLACLSDMLQLILLWHFGKALLCGLGNRSNMYAVANYRPYTNDPVSVMNKIRLSRAFTCYQVLAMIQASSRQSQQQPLVILDLLATFLMKTLTSKTASLFTIACFCSKDKRDVRWSSVRVKSAIADQRKSLLDQLKANVDVCWEEPLLLPDENERQLTLF